MKYIFSALCISFLLFSCGISDEERLQRDTDEIVSYLEENKLLDDAKVTSTGMYYIIHNPGNPGIVPSLNNTVTCNYTGYFPNGDLFDTGKDVSFTLGNTIPGWRQGIPLIGQGGVIQLFIPSYLAYGKNPPGSIPKNAVLFFDVDLLKVK